MGSSFNNSINQHLVFPASSPFMPSAAPINTAAPALRPSTTPVLVNAANASSVFPQAAVDSLIHQARGVASQPTPAAVVAPQPMPVYMTYSASQAALWPMLQSVPFNHGMTMAGWQMMQPMLVQQLRPWRPAEQPRPMMQYFTSPPRTHQQPPGAMQLARPMMTNNSSSGLKAPGLTTATIAESMAFGALGDGQGASISPTNIQTTSGTDSLARAPSRKRQRDVLEADEPGSRKSSSPLFDSLDGEHRLSIEFESFGTRGAFPQTFSRERWLIPDGIKGTHKAYDETWSFEVRHTDNRVPETDLFLITWRITNVKTQRTIERTETIEEAKKRGQVGWIIASKVFVEALKDRVESLKEELANETNALIRTNMVATIRALQPKGFTQGPLMFGLRHRIAQMAVAGEYPK